MDPLTPQAAVVAIGCLIACITDLRSGKIYNWTTGPMVILGIAMNAAIGQWMFALIGLVASTAVHYVLFYLGVQKGGDAKLIIGIGTLLGAWFMVETTLWYAIFYLPAGLAVLVFRGRLGNLLAVMRHDAAKRAGKATDDDKPPVTMMKTAPVITAAAIAAFATPWLHFVMFGASTVAPVSTGG